MVLAVIRQCAWAPADRCAVSRAGAASYKGSAASRLMKRACHQIPMKITIYQIERSPETKQFILSKQKVLSIAGTCIFFVYKIII